MKKANVAFTMITTILLILIVSTSFFLFTQPYQKIYDNINAKINNETASHPSSVPNEDKKIDRATTNLYNYWKYWPILIIIGLVLWATLKVLRRETSEQFI